MWLFERNVASNSLRIKVIHRNKLGRAIFVYVQCTLLVLKIRTAQSNLPVKELVKQRSFPPFPSLYV